MSSARSFWTSGSSLGRSSSSVRTRYRGATGSGRTGARTSSRSSGALDGDGARACGLGEAAELAEQAEGVVRARRGLGVVLNREELPGFVEEPFARTVVEVDVRHR